LDGRGEGLRHELKLVADESARPEVLMALRLDPSGIRSLHPERLVQSVYLDTPFQRALEENLAGLSSRRKLRFRWYGAEARGVRGRIEQKCRENALGWKETLDLDEPRDVAGADRRSFVADLVLGAGPLWRARLAALEPAQWIRYRREYFASADRRLRLTLDRELVFADQRLLRRLSDAAPSPAPRILVLEVKCAPGDLAEARALVGRLPIPLGRCSKFVLASQPAGGPLASIYGVA
jgi:hypothetical protein